MGEKNFDDYMNTVADFDDDESAGTLDPLSSSDLLPDDKQQQPVKDDATFQDDGASDNKTAQNNDPKAKQQAEQNGQQQQGQQPQKGNEAANKGTLRPLGDGTFADGKGNIVDGEGNMIAERGFAARIYKNFQSAKAENQELAQKLATAETALRERNVIMDAARNAQLSNDDMAMAIDLASKVRQGKVVEAAKDVLAILVSHGYNVTDLLGGDVGDSIEMRAMQRMLDDRLNPIIAPMQKQQQLAQQQSQTEQIAVQKYNDFIRENEYAELHGDAIVLISQNEGVSLQTAYNRLVMIAAKNGFDLSQPLPPQIEARKAQMQLEAHRAAQQPQQQQRTMSKPMPHGVRPSTGAQVSTAESLAEPDDSWASIIQSAMRG